MKKDKDQLLCKLMIIKRIDGFFDWEAIIFRDAKVLFSQWILKNEEPFDIEEDARNDAEATLKCMNIQLSESNDCGD